MNFSEEQSMHSPTTHMLGKRKRDLDLQICRDEYVHISPVNRVALDTEFATHTSERDTALASPYLPTINLRPRIPPSTFRDIEIEEAYEREDGARRKIMLKSSRSLASSAEQAPHHCPAKDDSPGAPNTSSTHTELDASQSHSIGTVAMINPSWRDKGSDLTCNDELSMSRKGASAQYLNESQYNAFGPFKSSTLQEQPRSRYSQFHPTHGETFQPVLDGQRKPHTPFPTGASEASSDEDSDQYFRNMSSGQSDEYEIEAGELFATVLAPRARGPLFKHPAQSLLHSEHEDAGPIEQEHKMPSEAYFSAPVQAPARDATISVNYMVSAPQPDTFDAALPRSSQRHPLVVSRHALQDYQLQLMLLEQQNKKRLLRARREDDYSARREREQAEEQRKAESEFMSLGSSKEFRSLQGKYDAPEQAQFFTKDTISRDLTIAHQQLHLESQQTGEENSHH